MTNSKLNEIVQCSDCDDNEPNGQLVCTQPTKVEAIKSRNYARRNGYPTAYVAHDDVAGNIDGTGDAYGVYAL